MLVKVDQLFDGRELSRGKKGNRMSGRSMLRPKGGRGPSRRHVRVRLAKKNYTDALLPCPLSFATAASVVSNWYEWISYIAGRY